MLCYVDQTLYEFLLVVLAKALWAENETPRQNMC